jgi:hypothetical protein
MLKQESYIIQCNVILGLERVTIRENKQDVVGCQKLCMKKINLKGYDCNALQQNGSDKVKYNFV